MEPGNVDQQAPPQAHFKSQYSGPGVFHSDPYAFGDGDIVLQDGEGTFLFFIIHFLDEASLMFSLRCQVKRVPQW